MLTGQTLRGLGFYSYRWTTEDGTNVSLVPSWPLDRRQISAETYDGSAEIGAVEVLSASGLFRDGFESGDASAWSGLVP